MALDASKFKRNVVPKVAANHCTCIDRANLIQLAQVITTQHRGGPEGYMSDHVLARVSLAQGLFVSLQAREESSPKWRDVWGKR